MFAAALTAREAGHSRVWRPLSNSPTPGQTSVATELASTGAASSQQGPQQKAKSSKPTKKTHYKSAVMLEFKAARAQRMLKLVDTPLLLKASTYARDRVGTLQFICFAQ